MGRLAFIQYLDGRPEVDNSLPGGGYPSQGLPSSPGHPSTGPVLPPGGALLPVWPFDPTDPGYGVGRPERPDQGLPGSGGRPDNDLPGSGNYPSHGLPSSPGHPSGQPIVPGRKFVVKFIACHGLILVPDNELPETPEPK